MKAVARSATLAIAVLLVFVPPGILAAQLSGSLSGPVVGYVFDRNAGNLRPLKGILAVSDEPLVSCDYNGDLHSSTVDSALTTVTGDLCKVMSWYDNEMGYSQRMYDLAKFVAEKL